MKSVGFVVVITISILMVVSLFVQGEDNSLIQRIEGLEKQVAQLESALSEELMDKKGQALDELEIRIDNFIEEVGHIEARLTLLEFRFLETFAERIEKSAMELEIEADDYLSELEKLVDLSTLEELGENLNYYVNRIDDLDRELEEETDAHEMMDILEEMELNLKEMVFMIKETLESFKELNDEEAIKEDLISYYELVEYLGEKEYQIATSFSNVTGQNYTSDESFHQELKNNMLPETEGLLNELKNIRPKTKEVNELHAIFIEGWELQQQAFLVYKEALEEQNEDKILEGNYLLEKGSSMLDTFAKRLEIMAEKYSVQLD